MTSTHILVFHTALFVTFIVVCVASSIFTIVLPELIPGKYIFFGALLLAGLVIGSWALYGGCPFTILENRYREREYSGSAYQGPCIDRYTKEWLRIQLPKRLSTVMLIGFLLFPAITGLIYW